MPLTTDAKGVYPIAPTPFFDDGSIDTSSIDRMMDFYLECGSTGITVLGQLGEAPKLEHAESLSVASQVIARARGIPVIVGVSAPGFAAMRALTRDVMERGADGANTGYCFPDMLCDVVRLNAQGQREEAHDLFDAHLPLLRYEQQPGAGLAVRKYVLMRRGILTSAAQRNPASPMSPTARQEVDHLLARLARKDPRAGKLAPQ